MEQNTEFGWGLELELPLINMQGNLLYIDDFEWVRLNEILKDLSPQGPNYFKSKYPGNDGHNFYLEGFDVFDQETTTKLVELKVKGVEIRTGVHEGLDSCLIETNNLFTQLRNKLAEYEMKPAILGCHPSGYTYYGEQSGRTYDDWKAAEVTMTTAGLHVNLSVPFQVEQEIDLLVATRQFDFWSPGMAIFSFNSPFFDGGPWVLNDGAIGKSSRSFLRSFYRNVLSVKPGILGKRYHISLFDMIPSLEKIGALAELSMGILLSSKSSKLISRAVRSYNISEVAKYGFDAKIFDGNTFISSAFEVAKESLSIAREGLLNYSLVPCYLNQLEEILDKKFLFADQAISEYLEHRSFSSLMLNRQGFLDSDKFIPILV